MTALDAGVGLVPGGARGNDSVVPGNIRTPALEAVFAGQDDPDAVYEKAVAMTSVGRPGSGEDVAEADLHLARTPPRSSREPSF